MEKQPMTDRWLYAYLIVSDRISRRDERGDVPGWVLITVMTAGIVTALWGFAGPQMKSMLAEALSGVRGPGGK